MTDKMNDKIRETMHEVEVPKIVDQAMENAFTKIRSMQENDKTTNLTSYKRSRWSARKMAAMVAVAVLAVGGSVFAGVKLYQMHFANEAAYSVSLGVTASQEDAIPEYVDDVEVKVQQIPDGCEPSDKYHIGYWNEEKEFGFYASETPYLIDTEEDAIINSVIDAESLMVGDHEALYIEEKHSYLEGWMNGTLFVLYPEIHRLEEIANWGYTSKEDLIAFAESVELVPTGKQVESSELPKWSEYVRVANENEEYLGAGDEESYPTSVAKSDLQLAKMNESVDFKTFIMNESMDEVTLDACIKNYRVEDNGSDLAYYINYGDGKNSLVTVVQKEERALSRVTATMEITNTTDQDLTDVYFYCPVLMLNESADQLTVDWLANGISDSIRYENNAAESGEMYSYTVNGETLTKNYIPSLKAGETASLEISWIVDKAQADKLYVVLNGSTVLDGKTMEVPIIKLEK